jgi:hypothetical protein
MARVNQLSIGWFVGVVQQALQVAESLSPQLKALLDPQGVFVEG